MPLSIGISPFCNVSPSLAEILDTNLKSDKRQLTQGNDVVISNMHRSFLSCIPISMNELLYFLDKDECVKFVEKIKEKVSKYMCGLKQCMWLKSLDLS